MRKRRFAFFLFIALSVAPFFCDASVIKVVNGRVKEVRAKESELVLFVQRPATGKTEDWVLKVDRGTGFKQGVSLQDFHPNDPVSVDYEEISGGTLRAIQVRRVPLRGIPNEIHRL